MQLTFQNFLREGKILYRHAENNEEHRQKVPEGRNNM